MEKEITFEVQDIFRAYVPRKFGNFRLNLVFLCVFLAYSFLTSQKDRQSKRMLIIVSVSTDHGCLFSCKVVI